MGSATEPGSFAWAKSPMKQCVGMFAFTFAWICNLSFIHLHTAATHNVTRNLCNFAFQNNAIAKIIWKQMPHQGVQIATNSGPQNHKTGPSGSHQEILEPPFASPPDSVRQTVLLSDTVRGSRRDVPGEPFGVPGGAPANKFDECLLRRTPITQSWRSFSDVNALHFSISESD